MTALLAAPRLAGDPLGQRRPFIMPAVEITRLDLLSGG